MKDINEKVDTLLSVKGYNGAGRKSYSKKSAKGSIAIAVMLAGMIIAGAGIMLFNVSVESDFEVEAAWTWDSQEPEILSLERSIDNICGGNTYEFTHWINATALMQDNLTLNFEFTGDTDEGITSEILYLGSPVTTLVIDPDTQYIITEKYSVSPMIEFKNETGYDYSITLTVTSTD